MAPAGLPDELCPSCGSALERPGNLAELVGFRAITSHDRAAEGCRASTHHSLVDRLGDLDERRALTRRHGVTSSVGATSPGAAAEAVALPRPETTC